MIETLLDEKITNAIINDPYEENLIDISFGDITIPILTRISYPSHIDYKLFNKLKIWTNNKNRENTNYYKSEIELYSYSKEIKKPKISIIIPAYNVEKYIGECLLSIIKQTFKELEIIIINDGSTDRTEEIIKLFMKDKRIKLISQENQGLSNARNKGISIAKGEYIGFIDSDDWIDKNYYEELLKTISKYKADYAIASVLKHKKFYKKYNVLHKKENIAISLKDKIKISEDRTHRLFNVWNKLYKKDFLLSNNITFPEGRIFEDTTFNIKAIFYAKKIVTVPKVKYHYRQRTNSIINSKDINGQKKEDYILAYEEIIEFAYKNNMRLPEGLNYSTSYYKGPFKIYKGKYKKKITLLGLVTLISYQTEKKNVKFF